jgi:hypothetical protein
MTKIYQQSPAHDQFGFWVTRPDNVPRYFNTFAQHAVDSFWTNDDLAPRIAKGILCRLTHAAALDLLAHWPAGHAELTKILADDPESDAVNNERNE